MRNKTLYTIGKQRNVKSIGVIAIQGKNKYDRVYNRISNRIKFNNRKLIIRNMKKVGELIEKSKGGKERESE